MSEPSNETQKILRTMILETIAEITQEKTDTSREKAVTAAGRVKGVNEIRPFRDNH